MSKQEPLPEGQIKNNDRKTLKWLSEQPIDTKLEMIEHHLSLSQLLINELLEEEVERKAGSRYSHGHRYYRWGTNPGSARVGDRKLRFQVPRLYDREEGHCHSPESYQRLKDQDTPTDQLLRGILKGLSMRDYEEVVDYLGESFGLSKSSVSERFRQRASQALKDFEERDLTQHEIIAMFMDGKYLAGEQVIIALGVSREGHKIPLSFVHAPTERHQPIQDMLTDIQERGVNFEEGMLFVIDGSKGLRKAIKDQLGACGVVQRCWWHKRENILSYIPEKAKEQVKAGFHQALSNVSYEDARSDLLALEEEIRPLNRTAANSLREGREELLTLHRLGLNTTFGKSFTTTNCIENVNRQLDKYVGKIRYWKTSRQRHQWIAAGLLEVESRMRRVDHYKQLDRMKKAIKQEVQRLRKNRSSP